MHLLLAIAMRLLSKKNKNESVTRLFLLVLFLTKQNSKNKKKK
jgi:hypothetical protein